MGKSCNELKLCKWPALSTLWSEVQAKRRELLGMVEALQVRTSADEA